MSAQRYDLIVGRESNDKTYWTKIGSAWPAKNGGGFSLTFDALPLPGKDGQARVLMREPQVRDGEPPRQAARGGGNAPMAGADIDDSIPFSAEWR